MMKKYKYFFEIETALILIGMVAVGLVLFSLSTNVTEKHVPMAELSSNLMRKVDIAHLWLEEGLKDSSSLDIEEEVFGNLNQAIALIHAVLFEPGVNLGGLQELNRDEEGSRLLTILYHHLRLFEALTRARWNDAREGNGGYKVSPAYRGVYSEIRNLGVQIQERVDLFIMNDHIQLERTHRTVAGLLFTLLMGISYVVLRDRRAMSDKNMELEVRADELNTLTDALQKRTQELSREIAVRKEAEESVRAYNELMVIVSHTQSEFISERNTRDLFNELLGHILSLTHSKYGFIGEILHDSSGKPYLKTHAISDISWNDETRSLLEKSGHEGLTFSHLNTLFGAVITGGRPVISNEPSSDPRRGGLPEGHPPLETFLGLPFHSGKKLVGMMGIANRSGGYNQALVDFLHPLVATCANIIEANRNDQKRREAEQALKKSEARFSGILDIANEAIISIDQNHGIVIFNKGAEQIFGYREEEILGRTLDFLIPERFRAMHREHVKNFSKSEGDSRLMGERREILGLRSNGEEFPAEASISKLETGKETIFTVVLRDISDRKKAELALSEQAIRDSLTNLYNRRFFNHCVEEEIRSSQRTGQGFAVMLCDLDRFKAINDSKGHQEGDDLLKGVAQSIKNSVRGIDSVFRWGGDEFVVLLADSDRKGVMIATDRVREGIQRVGQNIQYPLDVSIGVALYPDHGRDAESLIRISDRAMYIAKKGGDKVHLGEEEYILNEHSIKVVFQPVVDSRMSRIIGYEALSRDAQGRLSILELFKKYHAVGQLSELKLLCFRSQMKAARQVGLEKVFINVDFNLLRQIEPEKKPDGIEVILEISEGEALHDVENHLEAAKKWRDQGFKFAIDDFGAGFISLPFIVQLIPEYIKLDRSTVLQAVSSPKFRRIMNDLLLGLRNCSTDGIIAEGIETPKELQTMKDLGIYLAQGYLLGKPQELKAPSA